VLSTTTRKRIGARADFFGLAAVFDANSTTNADQRMSGALSSVTCQRARVT
jgi:hypothetical protein